MKYLVPLISVLLFASAAIAAPACTEHILNTNSNLRISAHPSDRTLLRIDLHTANNSQIRCADRPRSEARQLRRLAKVIGGKERWSVDDLISFSARNWPALSRSASQRIAKRSRVAPNEFAAPQLLRIERLILEAEPEKIVATNLMRSLSQLVRPEAFSTLENILKTSSNSHHQLTAARMIAKTPSPFAGSVLRKCAQRDDRLVSAQCRHSLTRWQARAKAKRALRQ